MSTPQVHSISAPQIQEFSSNREIGWTALIVPRFSHQINRLFLIESLIDVKLEWELKPSANEMQQQCHVWNAKQ